MDNNYKIEDKFIEKLIEITNNGKTNGELPIGALLVHKHSEILSINHNKTVQNKNRLAHAEMLCLEEGSLFFKGNIFTDTTLFVSLAPCHMCISASIICGVSKIIYLLDSDKWGFDKYKIYNNRSPLIFKSSSDYKKELEKLLKTYKKKRESNYF